MKLRNGEAVNEGDPWLARKYLMPMARGLCANWASGNRREAGSALSHITNSGAESSSLISSMSKVLKKVWKPNLFLVFVAGRFCTCTHIAFVENRSNRFVCSKLIWRVFDKNSSIGPSMSRKNLRATSLRMKRMRLSKPRSRLTKTMYVHLSSYWYLLLWPISPHVPSVPSFTDSSSASVGVPWSRETE
jgi:hypothetical protein